MLEQMYTRYHPWLVQWCTAMTGDPHLAEDLAQDTFLRALEHLEQLEQLGENQLRSWLKHTARNRYIDLFRRAKVAPAPELEDRYVDDYTQSLVQTLCAQLSEEERTLFLLRYFEGYNATELGELFGMKPSTVRARLSSARAKLKTLYLAD